MEYKELELAGIHVPELLARLMNNTALMKMIISKFLVDPSYNKLKTAVEQKDMQAAEFACHTLKGVCGNLAQKKLFELTQEQMRLFRAGQQEEAVGMMDAVTAEYELTVEHLHVWLSAQ